MSGTRAIVGRFRLSLVLGGGLMAFAAAVPAVVVGQEGGEADDQTAAVEDPIEWNFRSVPVAEPETTVSLQERWDAPFAVVSSGRPAPREPRRVVVPPATEVARRTAAVAADSGETVAEVTVEGEAEGEVLAAAVVGADGDDAEADSDSEAVSDSDSEGESEAESEAEADSDSDDDAASDAEPSEEPSGGEATAAPRRHTVTRGDTLYGIARRYGVSPASIRAANRLPDDIVRLGQTLVIPREEASR